MDVTSYLLGKNAGGGGSEINNQNKNVTITTNGNSTVTADSGYTGLGTVGITTNVQPDLESKTVTITENGTTTITPTTGKDGLSSVEVTTNVSGGGSEYQVKIDLSIQSSYASGFSNKIVKILPDLDTSQITDFRWFFKGCSSLTEIPPINTSKGIRFSDMFEGCTALTTIPILDFSASYNANNIFPNCPNFTDKTLDNILVSLMSGNYVVTQYKKLSEQGFTASNYPASRIEALPHYQDFLDAGWTIGY